MRRRRTRGEVRLLLVTAGALAVAGGIAVLALRTPAPPEIPRVSADRTAQDGRTRSVELEDYVALGDSFAAAPGVPGRATARVFPFARACVRSTGNYPQLVADKLDLVLDDRTCSGASPGDLGLGQETIAGVRVPPQLGALSRKTDVVTLSIGGNEGGLAVEIIEACREAASFLPAEQAPCTRQFGDDGLRRAGDVAEDAEDAVVRLIDEIDSRAPRARIIVVGYANYFSARQTCPGTTGIAPGDFAYLRAAYTLIVGATRRAADRTRSEYVDPRPSFEDHLICSADPYVNGATGGPGAFHLNAAGQRVLADLVTRTIAEGQ